MEQEERGNESLACAIGSANGLSENCAVMYAEKNINEALHVRARALSLDMLVPLQFSGVRYTCATLIYCCTNASICITNVIRTM